MRVKAVAKRLRIAPQKARLVADQVRGKPVAEALNILNFSTQKSASLVRKVLESAIANAENNEAADVELYNAQYLRAIKRLCEKYDMSDHVLLEGSTELMVKAQQLGLTNKLFLFSRFDQGAVNLADSLGFFGISASIDR